MRGRHNSLQYLVNLATGCWEWNLVLSSGYGYVWHGGRLRKAAIIYWEKKNGPIPANKELDHVCHSSDLSCPGGVACRHRRCVNPDHLELVTHAENIHRSRGTKLTIEQVLEIRQSNKTQRSLARQFNVSNSNICRIKSGEAWKCLS